MSRSLAPLALLSLSLALGPAAPPARPGVSGLDREMQQLARQVQAVLKGQGRDRVALGPFDGPADLASTGGPRIVESLRRQLEALGLRTGAEADLILRGEYRPALDDDSGMAALQIAARLVEKATGRSLVEFHARGMFDLTDIAAVAGTTLAMPPSAGESEREEKIAEALDKVQPPAVHGTRIGARPGSPYGIEILVGPDPGAGRPDPSRYRPRAPAVTAAGLAFVKIERGEVYAVKIINDADHDVAVTLTIDGLNVFTFSDNPRLKVLIVPAGKTGLVAGWHRTNAVSDAFQVAEYARSAAASRLIDRAAIGTIHASFKAAWPADGQPPADEGPAEPAGATARDADATARGQAVDARYTETVRSVGRLREAVAVHYNKAADPADLPDSWPETAK